MSNHLVTLSAGDSEPVKNYLQKKCGISATLWKKIKHSGTLTVNGAYIHPMHACVQSGDVIAYHLAHQAAIAPEPIPLSICYEDDALLIVDKPAGMLVHPTTSVPTGTLGNAVLFHYQTMAEDYAYHPVHRLDKNTSGLVLIAKRPEIHYLLTKNGKLFHRSYLAVVHDAPPAYAGIIDAPIARALPSIILRKIDPAGKAARTHYKLLERYASSSLLSLTLETGRTHQIRLHLAHIGCPILGDDLYGGTRTRIARQALHAHNIAFFHPITGESIHITAPLPADMKALLPTDAAFFQKNS